MNELCLDCKHSKHPEENNYCYMFEKAPEKLPCGQHDMYKKLRDENGKIILNMMKIFDYIKRPEVYDINSFYNKKKRTEKNWK